MVIESDGKTENAQHLGGLLVTEVDDQADAAVSPCLRRSAPENRVPVTVLVTVGLPCGGGKSAATLVRIRAA
jgi:hypothetical protein